MEYSCWKKHLERTIIFAKETCKTLISVFTRTPRNMWGFNGKKDCTNSGFSSALRSFTKLMTFPISILRRLNVILILYLDDILFIAWTQEEITFAWYTLIFLLQCLGFLVDIKKSVLQPCQKIEFLNWSLQRQYILEFLKQECVFRSQDRVALVGQQPKIEQRKVHSYLENSINNIMSCLKEVLGRLLWRMQNRGNMVRIACQGSYKRTMTESSKIWCNGVHKSFSNCQGSLLIHQQYSSTLTIWRRWWKGSHNKILSNLIKEIWNYFFRNRITISVEYLSKVFNPEADF